MGELLFYYCLLRFVSPLRLPENSAKGKAPRQLQWNWNLINLESKLVSVTYIDSISHCGLRLGVGELVLTLLCVREREGDPKSAWSWLKLTSSKSHFSFSFSFQLSPDLYASYSSLTSHAHFGKDPSFFVYANKVTCFPTIKLQRKVVAIWVLPSKSGAKRILLK